MTKWDINTTQGNGKQWAQHSQGEWIVVRDLETTHEVVCSQTWEEVNKQTWDKVNGTAVEAKKGHRALLWTIQGDSWELWVRLTEETNKDSGCLLWAAWSGSGWSLIQTKAETHTDRNKQSKASALVTCFYQRCQTAQLEQVFCSTCCSHAEKNCLRMWYLMAAVAAVTTNDKDQTRKQREKGRWQERLICALGQLAWVYAG